MQRPVSPCRPTRRLRRHRVNPRVSRSSALASKATAIRSPGSPPRSRRAPAGRDPNVVTGTTVAAFEPALDYVVVKLPALPVRQVPGRRSDARVADEGDRRGDGDRPDLRVALQQGAARSRAGGGRPAGRGSGLDVDLRLLARLRRRRRRRRCPHPLDRRDRPGLRIDPPRAADRRADRCFAASSSRPISRLWRLLGLLRRGVPEAVVGEATGISAWFLAEMGRNVALERRSPEWGGPRRPDRYSRQRAAGDYQARRVRRQGAGGLAGTTSDALRRARLALGLRPGYAMVDTCAAEFAAETPLLLFDLRRGRLGARGATRRARGGPRHRLRGRSASARGSSSTTARSRRRIRSAARLASRD